MDKVSLIKREAEKFVALSKKNKQELQDIKDEKKDLTRIGNDLAEYALELENKDNTISDKLIEIRDKTSEVKELDKQTTDNLESIKTQNKKLKLQQEQNEHTNREILSEKEKIKREKLNIENLKSVEKLNKELVVKQEDIKRREQRLEVNRDKLKTDRDTFRSDTAKGKQDLKDYEENIGSLGRKLCKDTDNLNKQKTLQNNRSEKLLDRETAIEDKLGIIRDKDADLASRELDLKNFIKGLKKEHGLKKLKKEGLL